MNLRKAVLRDAPFIYSLINTYAKEGILLPRSLNSIYENIRDFWVYEEKGQVVGCCALHVVWEDLAEIKSLAIRKDMRGKGIGTSLVQACLKEAKELGVKRVFALTYAVDFFEKLGFYAVPKESLPHKVWGECINCVKFPSCDETAVQMEVEKASLVNSHEDRF
ncbi:N-acetyltransferase [Thermocrinis sp.]